MIWCLHWLFFLHLQLDRSFKFWWIDVIGVIDCFLEGLAAAIVFKPKPVRRVDLGPGRSGGWTGPGLLKNHLGQQSDKTRSTRRIDPWPERPGQTRTRPSVLELGPRSEFENLEGRRWWSMKNFKSLLRSRFITLDFLLLLKKVATPLTAHLLLFSFVPSSWWL